MADITGLEEKIRRHAEALVADAADRMVIAMQGDVPQVTGALYQSIGHDAPELGGNTVYCGIYAKAYHAVFIDQGRGPVVPVYASVLVWDAPHGGGKVFSMYSKAVPPNPFFSERMPLRWEDELQNAAFAVVTS